MFAEVCPVTLKAVIETEVDFAVVTDLRAELRREILAQPEENSVFRKWIVGVFGNPLEFTLDADDEGLACLNVKIGHTPSLTPLE